MRCGDGVRIGVSRQTIHGSAMRIREQTGIVPASVKVMVNAVVVTGAARPG